MGRETGKSEDALPHPYRRQGKEMVHLPRMRKGNVDRPLPSHLQEVPPA